MRFLSFVPFLSAALLVHAIPANLTERQSLARVITRCTAPNTAALTFDDGPYLYTNDISNTLNAAGAKGTFFFNGNNYGCIYSSDNAQRVKNVYNQGHQVSSHTWAHLSNLATLSSDQINSELSKVELAFQRIIGVKPAFVRPPYGSYNNLVRQIAASRGQNLVTWDFDSGDSTGSSPAQSKQAYTNLANRHPSTILALNHDVYERSAHDVLPHAISVLQTKGYRLVTVAECLGMPAYSSVGSPQSGSFSC